MVFDLECFGWGCGLVVYGWIAGMIASMTFSALKRMAGLGI